MKKLLPLLLLIFSCEEVLDNLNPDITAPTVLITYPVNESTLTATTIIKADVTDDSDISSVKFLIDGTEVYADTTSPYEYEWDICVLGTGSHSVLVKTEDSAGNKGQSDLLTFTINANYDCADVCGGDKLLDNCGTCDTDSSNDCSQDCWGDWGGTAEVDDCGLCDNDSSNDCSPTIYECLNTGLELKLEIQNMTLLKLLDWESEDIELAKLSIKNHSYTEDIDYYINYYAKLNNQYVAYGRTYNYWDLPPDNEVSITNNNFDPYSIQTYFVDNSLLYSLNTIGYLVSGNYEIGIELIHPSNEGILCTVTLDSLYIAQ